MDDQLKVGDRVRLTVRWVTGCKPGDVGTVARVTPVSSRGAYYHVIMDHLPPAARTVICYPNELEPAPKDA